MTLEIGLVLGILLAAVALFVTEWVRMDLVALLVLSVLAITGLVSPTDAIGGFSNPAVVTVWAMFILSEGLARAGIADIIGHHVMRGAGRSETRMIAIFMLAGGTLSAFMNNIGVAALMLPVVVEVARRSGVAPSRLLMPLAYGTLLGGLMTLIGTPPNLVVSADLRDAGYAGFRFFDFSFVGLPILLVGTAFVALVGRHLLPRTDTTKPPAGQQDLRAQYGLQERIVALRIPGGALLAGKTLAESGLGSAAGLMVISLSRVGGTVALPHRDTMLRSGDVLLAQGRLDRLDLLRRWSALAIEREAPALRQLIEKKAAAAAAAAAEGSRAGEADPSAVQRIDEHVFALRVPRDSALAGTTLGENRLGDAFDFRLLGIFRDGALIEDPGSDEVVGAGDLLVIQGREEDLDVLRGLQQIEVLDDATPYLGVLDQGELDLVEATLHPHSRLAGRSVADLKLIERYRVRVAAIWRDGRPYRSALGAMTLQRGDALLIVGPRHRLAALNADEDLIVLNPVHATPVDSSKAPVAGALMLLVVGSVLVGFLPIAIAAVTGAALMVLTRCLTMEQAYRAISWRSIFLIAGMLPLGVAMQRTGAAEYVAGGVLDVLGGYGPWPVIAGLYGVTALATLAVPTVVSVVLMAPIALSVSGVLGISPYAPMMAVAIAASASLASPLSHPANVLVMGPGGYRFVDYLKLGLPLAFLVFLVTALLLPVFWRL